MKGIRRRFIDRQGGDLQNAGATASRIVTALVDWKSAGLTISAAQPDPGSTAGLGILPGNYQAIEILEAFVQFSADLAHSAYLVFWEGDQARLTARITAHAGAAVDTFTAGLQLDNPNEFPFVLPLNMRDTTFWMGSRKFKVPSAGGFFLLTGAAGNVAPAQTLEASAFVAWRPISDS